VGLYHGTLFHTMGLYKGTWFHTVGLYQGTWFHTMGLYQGTWFHTVGLYKGTSTTTGSSALCYAAMFMFSFYGFWLSNILSFWCEAVMDVSILLNSIHYTWWSAIVFVINSTAKSCKSRTHAWLHSTKIKNARASSSCLGKTYNAKPICTLGDGQLGLNMWCVCVCVCV
jgi:hypothetical protein